MIFTPDSIKKQQFNRSLRGFDTEEVHAFLEKLSAEFETILAANETLQTELDETKTNLEKYIALEQQLSKEISEIRDKSTKKIEEAKEQAEKILKFAEEKAIELVQKSQDEAEKLKSAVMNLREEKDMIITKLKTIINYQSHVLEMGFEEKDSSPKEGKKI
jgi:cell division initiation protein